MEPPLDLPETIAVTTYCIAHTDPVIPLSEETIQLEIGPPNTLDRNRYREVVNCFELVPFGERYRRELGSTLGSFAARRHILQSGRPLNFAVNMSSYRTFMLNDKRPARHDDWMRMNFITPDEARALGDLVLPSEVTWTWRLPMPIPLPSLAENYAVSHHIEDLDLYLEVAMAEGVVTAAENEQCRNTPYLLPGALSVGMMPAQLFCDLNEQLEVVTRGFLERFSPEGRDDYQIRAANFCHERLGSYLIERHIRKVFGELKGALFGYWTRVDPELTLSQGFIPAQAS